MTMRSRVIALATLSMTVRRARDGCADAFGRVVVDTYSGRFIDGADRAGVRARGVNAYELRFAFSGGETERRRARAVRATNEVTRDDVEIDG